MEYHHLCHEHVDETSFLRATGDPAPSTLERGTTAGPLDRRYETCCGIDIHKQTAVACLITTGPRGQRARETRTFATTTEALGELRDWLRAADCTHVAIERTGVDWKPAFNVLEEHCTVIVVNAAH